jgi:hypothetical protein
MIKLFKIIFFLLLSISTIYASDILEDENYILGSKPVLSTFIKIYCLSITCEFTSLYLNETPISCSKVSNGESVPEVKIIE